MLKRNLYVILLIIYIAFTCIYAAELKDDNPLDIPSPLSSFPLSTDKGLCFVKNIIKNPNIIVGDYTYYYDSENPANFEKNVLYHFDVLRDKLIIGKFCQIGTSAKFIMNGGNHSLMGFSTYPFQAFGGDWKAIPTRGEIKGDTVIGNDVWIGYGVTIMPGVYVGDGAIIGALSVVTRNIEPYSIVAGNPAKEIRKRFDEETVAMLLQLKWWEWAIEKITTLAPAIATGDKQKLKEAIF